MAKNMQVLLANRPDGWVQESWLGAGIGLQHCRKRHPDTGSR
jgi:hypothetical protein